MIENLKLKSADEYFNDILKLLPSRFKLVEGSDVYCVLKAVAYSNWAVNQEILELIKHVEGQE
jgi:hypothetical protein